MLHVTKEDNCIFFSSLKGHAHRVIRTAIDNFEIKCIMKRCAILQPWYMNLKGFFFFKYKPYIQLCSTVKICFTSTIFFYFSNIQFLLFSCGRNSEIHNYSVMYLLSYLKYYMDMARF